MKKLLASLTSLGFLVLLLFTFKAVDDYQDKKERTETYNAKIEDAYAAGAFVLSDNLYIPLEADGEYIGINIYGGDDGARLRISDEYIDVQIGDIFEVNGKQFEVYDIFENISPGRWQIAIREL